MSLLDTALDLAAHGCSVVPVAVDGTKRPAVAWKPGQTAAAGTDQLNAWFDGTTYDGLGIITRRKGPRSDDGPEGGDQ